MAEGNYRPLDLNHIKNTVRQESARLRLRAFSSEGESAFTLALALSAAVKKVFYEKTETTFSAEPVVEKKLVTQFVRRMRVDAMEKFNTTTVFSVIAFAAHEEGLKKQAYLLTMVVYMEQKFLPEFLRLLQYPYIDFDDDSEVKDGCGAVSNLIAGQYKKEMAALGYKDVTMSSFESHINTVPDGVGIPNGATEKYELAFEIDGAKRLVVEMITLARLPTWQKPEKKAPGSILVIDDDHIYVEQVRSYLKAKGYEVLAAGDGVEGIKQLKHDPDLVILDLHMPHMNGYEFILEIKRLRRDQAPPVVITTCQADLHDIVNIEGIKEYLVKPFQLPALLETVQRYV